MPVVELSKGLTVAVDVLAWGVIHAGTGYLAHRLPDRCFQSDSWLTRLRGVERSGRLWRVLRVAHWKDHLPEAGGFFAGGVSKRTVPSSSDADLLMFAALTRRAELTHWMAVAGSGLFVIWNPLWVVPVMVVYGVVVNAPFIAIQRYNRLRITRILSRRSARSRRDRETIGNNMPKGSPPNR